MNSPSPPESGEVFFLDRCLGKSVVAERLREVGLRVEIHVDYFPETESLAEADDGVWLREVGRRGWIILSKDKHIRSNQIEIVALLESGSPSFVLTTGTMTGEAMAEAFLKALPAMRRFVRKFAPPFVATVTASGNVKMFMTFGDLIKKID